MSTPAEVATRYAGLAAIEAGVTAAKKQANDELRKLAEQSALTKGEIATPFGPVTLAENKGSTTVVVEDEDAFIAWAYAQHPTAIETVTRLRAADRAAILSDRFVVVAGQVVDTQTGEQIDFAAAVKTDPAPPSPSYRASTQQKAAKAAAVEWATGRADVFVNGVKGMLIGPPPEFDPLEGE